MNTGATMNNMSEARLMVSDFRNGRIADKDKYAKLAQAAENMAGLIAIIEQKNVTMENIVNDNVDRWALVIAMLTNISYIATIAPDDAKGMIDNLIKTMRKAKS